VIFCLEKLKTDETGQTRCGMWISFDSTNSLFLVMESWTSTCLCLWDYEIIAFLGKKSATVAEVLGEVLGGAKLKKKKKIPLKFRSMSK
jgi:hypothetical protein